MNWKDKTILCTGGAGFLGGSITERLLGYGAIVDIVDNFTVGKPDSVPEGVRNVYEGDVDARTISRIEPGEYDMVFHFAAPCTILLFEDKDPLKMYLNALTAAHYTRVFCNNRKIPYLVYASSATYYGRETDNWHKMKSRGLNPFPFMENLPPSPANMYGATKTAEEGFDTIYPDLKTLALRIFPVYGAREKLKGNVASSLYKFAKDVYYDRQPELWGDGTQRRDFLYVKDFVDLVTKLVEKDAIGPYNIGASTNIDYNLCVYYINESFDKHIEPKYVPNPYPETYLNNLTSDNSKLMYAIHHEFLSYEYGIELMCREMMENGA